MQPFKPPRKANDPPPWFIPLMWLIVGMIMVAFIVAIGRIIAVLLGIGS